MTPEQQVITELEADYPGWQIWTVHRAVGHTLWCARPWSDERAVVNMDNPDQLREYLDQQT